MFKKNKKENFFKSFKHAGVGIIKGFKERNFKIQSIIALCVIILGFLLKITTTEWLIVLICIAIVLTSELFNSSIEKTVDYISLDINKNAKIIKDMAAGAVLLSAIISAIIGLIIFLPKINNVIF